MGFHQAFILATGFSQAIRRPPPERPLLPSIPSEPNPLPRHPALSPRGPTMGCGFPWAWSHYRPWAVAVGVGPLWAVGVGVGVRQAFCKDTHESFVRVVTMVFGTPCPVRLAPSCLLCPALPSGAPPRGATSRAHPTPPRGDGAARTLQDR